jgi:hypothetical protein
MWRSIGAVQIDQAKSVKSNLSRDEPIHLSLNKYDKEEQTY